MSSNPIDDEVLNHVKQDFLNLTKQYANTGVIIHQLANLPVMVQQVPLIQGLHIQFGQIGEQLKIIGQGLDAMGGESVMHGPKAKPGRTPSDN